MRQRLIASTLLLTACGPALRTPVQVETTTVTRVDQVTTTTELAPPQTPRVTPETPRTTASAPLVVASSGPMRVVCPASSAAPAGSPVRLRALTEGDVRRVRWSVTHGPQDHAWRFAERYDANDTDAVVADGAEVPFTSVIVGEYTLRADARDADGNTASCETTVTMRSHGLRVELSWNTQNTDVDLHMLAAPGEGWFSTRDCYYANRRPDTALGAEGLQRWLDTDDVDGEGPENIRIDEPTTGTGYAVGVHYYSSHGAHEPTRAIAVIYCGGERLVRMERPLRGDTAGGSSTNDFWTLGTVTFGPDGRCALQRIDRVESRASVQNPITSTPALVVAH